MTMNEFLKSDSTEKVIDGKLYVKQKTIATVGDHEIEVVLIHCWSTTLPVMNTQTLITTMGADNWHDTVASKLIGYYVDDAFLYAGNSMFLEIDNAYTCSSMINEYRESIISDVMKYASENMDMIPAVTEERERDEATTMFNKGCTKHEIADNDIRKTIEYFAELAIQKEKPDFIGLLKDISQKAAHVTELNRKIYNYISHEKGKMEYLQKLISQVEQGTDEVKKRIHNIQTILYELGEKETKTCKATFCFGEKEITKQISVDNVYSWIEGNEKQTKKFVKNNYLPIAMGIDLSRNDFLPYIVKISSRGKTIYSAEPMEVIKEESLYHFLLESEKEVTCDELEDRFGDMDCSLPIKNGYSKKNGRIMERYIFFNFYSTVEGVQYLIKHGADPKELPKDLYESPYASGPNYLKSRNFKAINDYLSSIS